MLHFSGSKVIGGTLLGHIKVEFILTCMSILSLNGGQAITGYLEFDAITPLNALLLPAYSNPYNISILRIIIIYNTYNLCCIFMS